MEQASIWCFFSIAQIAIMLFCIRETLIINWGRGKHQSLITNAKQNEKKTTTIVENEKVKNH